MFLSLNWIKKFVNLPSVKPEQLALDLTMSTVEVEEVVDQRRAFEDMVIGRIEELVKHPQADRLWICKTTVGSETLQIVCGGSNLKEGMLVIVAKVGSQVRWHGEGDLVKLEPAKIRGQESQGMIVASAEVGLSSLFPALDEHEIVDLSGYNFKVGTPVADALGLNDVILDIDNKSMTHRPDLWGQYGLAREVAAIYQQKLATYKVKPIPEASGKKKLEVKVKTELCNRYSVVVMDNIKIGPSPWWLKVMLESVGLRSINNVVDVTNFLMMEIGQPMHAFDYSLLAGQTIIVDEVKRKEKFVSLDGEKYDLPLGTVMIADKEKYTAIGGIKGGQNSGIKENTTTIVLESANFNASAIRRASAKLGLRTDASARHEKSLDPALTMDALARAVELLQKVSPGATVASAVVDVNNSKPATSIISLPKNLIVRMLGITIPDSQVKAILGRLSFGVKIKKETFEVTVPSFRATKDVTIPEDLVEEIARMYGYNNIEPSLPVVTIQQPPLDVERQLENEIKDRLVNSGHYYEVQNYSFASHYWSNELKFINDRLEVANVLTDEQRFMRTSLIPGLIQNVEDNLRWSQDFNLFEFGRVFKNKKGNFAVDSKDKDYLPAQPYYFSGVMVSKSSSVQDKYIEVKGMFEKLFAQYGIKWTFQSDELPYSNKRQIVKAHDQKFASFGLLNQELQTKHFSGLAVVWWELNFSKFIKHADLGRTFSALPKYPAVVRDVSLIFDRAITWEAINSEIKGVSGLITGVELFDIFQSKELGPNKRSLAFSLTFRSADKTLASNEVDVILKLVVAKLRKKFKAEVR